MSSNVDLGSAVASSERKLVAILIADVAGYSALMGRDDVATVQTLSEHRAVVQACVGAHNGKIDDAKGDAILAEFASAVNAVSCAVEIQRRLHERNASLAAERRMHLRIGVNLGDVIAKDNTVYGDGVNIAARLEALAEPGGICISRMVYENVKTRLPLTCESIGKKPMKNIAEPVEVFRVHLDSGKARKSPSTIRRMALGSMLIALGAIAVWQSTQFPTTPVAPAGVAALKVPEGASIAVLPFTNLSGKPEEDWFSDGITETLITDLSRLSNLFVIARNSSFTYKGKAVDVRRVGQELGVRYVLEGSVQRTGDRLRVNAQLLEATTGRHMWAERYDRTLADVFAVQDNITLQIVTELDATLLAGEQARAWRKTTRNRQAYDLYLRAKEHHNRGTREDVARAQALFQQALDLDHRFTTAMVWLGWSHIMQGDSGWSSDWRVSYQKAVASARRAIAIDPALGDAYAGLSQWLPALGEHREGVAAAEKAIALSPNQADALELSGQTLALNGRAEEAVSLIQRALRLNPFPPDWYYDGLGDSLLFLNRIEDAIAAHRKCVQGMPDLMWCRLSLTAGYALAGKTGEAAGQVKDILKINPNITAEANTWVISIGIPQDRARMIAALRIGGLP